MIGKIINIENNFVTVKLGIDITTYTKNLKKCRNIVHKGDKSKLFFSCMLFHEIQILVLIHF